MTPAARVETTIEILQEIETIPRPADALVSSYFRARRFIGSKDRAAISGMLYDILRHHARLNWWIERFNETPNPRLRTLAHLRLVEGFSFDDIDALCNGQKFSPEPLTRGERTFCRALDEQVLEQSEMPVDVAVECPDWASATLKKLFGKKFAAEMRAMLTQAPLDLRVNALKAERGPILKALKQMGLQAETCPHAPYGIRVHQRPSLAQLPMLKNGEVEIQDEGSQLAAALVDAKPGQRVVDFCAGAGGKTFAIAAQMQNKGRITACDLLSGRLKRSAERFRRAGVHNIEIKPLTTERDPWVKRHKDCFDRVLVDAPCSGTGTWRRNPDARWKHLGPGLEALIALQASILDSAARLVKKGGKLVYATCSLLPEENEAQIAHFLSTHEDFEVIDYQSVLKNKALPTGPYLSLTPHQHGTDGFFAAILARKA